MMEIYSKNVKKVKTDIHKNQKLINVNIKRNILNLELLISQYTNFNNHAPEKSTLFKNILRDQDERGEILSIADDKVSNVSIIKCSAHTIRSNRHI